MNSRGLSALLQLYGKAGRHTVKCNRRVRARCREETSEAEEGQVSARPTPRGYAFKNIDAGASSSAFALARKRKGVSEWEGEAGREEEDEIHLARRLDAKTSVLSLH